MEQLLLRNRARLHDDLVSAPLRRFIGEHLAKHRNQPIAPPFDAFKAMVERRRHAELVHRSGESYPYALGRLER